MTDEELLKRLRPLSWSDIDARFGVPMDETMREAADRIEQLGKACAEWADVSQSNYQRAKAAEAKLVKAVEALRKIGKTYSANGSRLIHSDKQIINMVYIALAEIKGDSHD
jgi:head-tail adaptor